MSDVLLVFFDELEYTESNESATASFDVSLFADLADADVGCALTTEGTSVQYHYHDAHERVKAHGHPSDLFDDALWVTDDALLSGDVRLRTGEVVSVTDYEVVLVSQVVFHAAYVGYLCRTFPELTVVPVQDESLWEVSSMSATLQRHQLESLSLVDGFVAGEPVYERWVSGLVDDVVRIPLPVPANHYPAVDPDPGSGRVALGCVPFNADASQFTNSVAVVGNLRERGYDLEAEIVGVREWQRDVVDGFTELPWVTTTGFLSEGYHEHLSGFEFAVNLTPRVSTGRCACDFGGVGVPCVGTGYNVLQARCFPDLSVGPLDVGAATDRCERLLTDPEFRRATVDGAREAIEDLQDHGTAERRLREFLQRVS